LNREIDILDIEKEAYNMLNTKSKAILDTYVLFRKSINKYYVGLSLDYWDGEEIFETTKYIGNATYYLLEKECINELNNILEKFKGERDNWWEIKKIRHTIELV
jgi:hypothetical protein